MKAVSQGFILGLLFFLEYIIRGRGYEWRSSDSALRYFISKITSQQHKILDKKASFIIFVG